MHDSLRIRTFLGSSLHLGVLAPEAELHAVPEADVDPVRLPDALLRDGHALDVVLQGGLDVVGLQGDPVHRKNCVGYCNILRQLFRI